MIHDHLTHTNKMRIKLHKENNCGNFTMSEIEQFVMNQKLVNCSPDHNYI